MAVRPDAKNLEVRKKYAERFFHNMQDIWREKVTTGRTRAYDTGKLYRALFSNKTFTHDADFLNLSFSYEYPVYGVYVERGVGRETFRGNNGDIGRTKKRKPRPWMNPKFYMSSMNMRDFIAEAVGRDFVNTIAEVLTN